MGNSSAHATAQPAPQHVAILDAGAQYGGLIDRNVRELGIRTVLLPLDTPASELADVDAVIISGGPKSVEDHDAYNCDPELFNLNKPILGICYGLQLMAKYQGGKVGKGAIREDGPQVTTFTEDSKLFKGVSGQQKVLMTHGDSVLSPPSGFTVSGQSEQLISAIEKPEAVQYGVQFHPEVFQTECGKDVFKNFLFGISKLTPDFSIEDQEEESIKIIQDTVGTKDVVVFVSGGVDSAVVAALIGKSIDHKQIHAFHIDTGLMRLDESKAVITALKDAGITVTLLDRADFFAASTTEFGGTTTKRLDQVTDPQEKRHIIGDAFIKVRSDILKDNHLNEDSILAQGSLRPDLIESGSQLASTKADTIKTHHNDSEAVRSLRRKNQVVEPLQDLYKDQVRAIGRRLGLPSTLVERHPFPGPGLAIRVICSEQPYRLDNHDGIQAQLDEFVVSKGFESFTATLLPIQTVGVQGDGRSYKYLAGLTGPMDWQKMSTLAALIPNYNQAVNRVAYVFGEPIDRTNLGITTTHLTRDVLDQLRQADAIVTEILTKNGLLSAMSQFPVISFPIDFGVNGGRSIALRPFKTPDFMTGLPVLPGDGIPQSVIDEMVHRILSEVDGIVRVAYDLSSKPPGTTEWE